MHRFILPLIYLAKSSLCCVGGIFLYQVVYVQQFQLSAAVVDGEGLIVSNRPVEGADGAVVLGAALLPIYFTFLYSIVNFAGVNIPVLSPTRPFSSVHLQIAFAYFQDHIHGAATIDVHRYSDGLFCIPQKPKEASALCSVEVE